MSTQFKGVVMPKRIEELERDHRGFPIPYVAEWDDEDAPFQPVFDKEYGLVAVTLGTRTPENVVFGHMAPQRQRECMLGPICQVCRRDLRNRSRFMAGGEGNTYFTEPATCLPCMIFAVRVCPGLVAGTRAERLTVHRVKKVTLYQARMGLFQSLDELNSALMMMPKEDLPGFYEMILPIDTKSDRSALSYIMATIDDSDEMHTTEFLAKFDN